MSTPDAQDKKVPQFSSFTMRPAPAPAESCCTDHACAVESAPAAEALSDARYSWQVDGMDCAAGARKVETAVRQVPGVSQVQVLSGPDQSICQEYVYTGFYSAEDLCKGRSFQLQISYQWTHLFFIER